MVRKLLPRHLRSERGAELIELALVLPILLLVFAGIVDFALVCQRVLTLSNAAREGARIAVLPGYQNADVIDRVTQYVREGTGDNTLTPTTVPVLITGETGTGKEVLARTIHACSTRSSATFLPFNCSGVPRDMLDVHIVNKRSAEATFQIDPDAEDVAHGVGALVILAVALALGSWRSYAQYREALSTAQQHRDFVPSLRAASIQSSDDVVLVTLPATPLALSRRRWMTGSARCSQCWP